MKNTSANRKQTGSQNPTRTTTQNMRYTTKCMTQSAFQKRILSLVQRAGDKVAEAMNLVDEAGAIAGINVHFERCVERDEHSKRTDVHDKSYEADGADDVDEFDEASDEIKEVTISELADMVAERTCFKPECTLCVLDTAFDIMDEQNLMLDLGMLSADTSEEETEDVEEDADDSEYEEEGADTDTEDDETYAECGCHDCDNCRHYDDCYGKSKSDSEYDDSGESSESYGNDDYDDDSEDFNNSYDCGDDDEIASQPTMNTRNSRNASRRGREW